MKMQEVNLATNDEGRKVLDMDAIHSLASHLKGDIIVPGDETYEKARRVWNGMIDRLPGMIVRCGGAADVTAAVHFARDNNIKLSVRGGGHNVAGLAVADDGMVIDLSGMRSVHVDPPGRTARAEGGATLGDLDRETQAFGLSVPLGVVSKTGVAGLTLHGGMGWLTRKYGMTIDNLLSADVVTADGRLLRAGPDENADLFWALRGGGGNFGIVTSFEFRVHPVGPEVWLGVPMYPLEKAEDAMRFFREYMKTAPEDLGAIAVFWSVPPVPVIPQELHGKPVLIFLSCYHGPFEEGEKALKPLREFDKPLADLSTSMKFSDVQKFLDPDYPDGRLYYWKSLHMRELTDEAIRAMAAYAGERPSPITSIDVWCLDGAPGRVGMDETPFSHRDAPYLFAIESNWDDPAGSEKNIAWTRKVFQEIKQYSTGGTYLNFPGFNEEKEELVKGAYGKNYERLRTIKRKYDPDNVFRGNFNIKA
jgi:FAD/FMN-containing dehydrogenase